MSLNLVLKLQLKYCGEMPSKEWHENNQIHITKSPHSKLLHRVSAALPQSQLQQSPRISGACTHFQMESGRFPYMATAIVWIWLLYVFPHKRKTIHCFFLLFVPNFDQKCLVSVQRYDESECYNFFKVIESIWERLVQFTQLPKEKK